MKKQHQQRVKQQLRNLLSKNRWLVFGLGNPGPEYSGNRHNVGHMVVDRLAAEAGATFSKQLGVAHVAKLRTPDSEIYLAKSLGFMNLSGGPVSKLSQKFEIPISQLVIVHDELDLDFGTLKIKLGGGHAGHNGLRDITAAMGPDYIRVRFGISRPKGDPAKYVLQNFSKKEQEDLPSLIEDAAHAAIDIPLTGLTASQQKWNSLA